MKLKGASLGFFAALFAQSAIAPAAAADAALIEAARKEGEVVWYTGFVIEQLARPLAEAFEKMYGVKVHYVRANSSDQVLRITNEAKAGKVMADVFDGAIGAATLKKEKLLASYLPVTAQHFPRELVDADKFWIGVNVYVLAPAMNTDLVPRGAEPRSWEDLLNPKWREDGVEQQHVGRRGAGIYRNRAQGIRRRKGDGLSASSRRAECRQHRWRRPRGNGPDYRR